jgi:2-polyprenyl-3-methyl-5-hydroxy-6-metoxy-1,4-benzoquinol methylase
MLFPGPLKDMFRSRGGQPGNGVTQPANHVRTQAAPRSGGAAALLSTRPSRGLEEFFTYIRDQSGLTILDLGGATQKNVTFITDLGHRLYSEDFLQILNDTFGSDGTTDQSNPGRIDYFLKQTLDYQEGQFDGVLVWDVLEYMAPALLNAVVERLQFVVRPKSYMLAFFHAEDKLDAVPFYTFRIGAANALEVAQQGMRRPAQLFNNRSLEKLFGRFESVKFFLTRERLREVIIKA